MGEKKEKEVPGVTCLIGSGPVERACDEERSIKDKQ